MNEYLPYLIFGLTAGSIYGISAMGLVLTYKTSGVFNFAHGAVSAVSAYVFYECCQVRGLPWPIAGFIAVFVFGPLAGLILERMAVQLAKVTVANRIVATVGLLVCILALAGIYYGPNSTFVFESFLPSEAAFTISGVAVSWDNVVNLAFGIALAVALWLFFTFSRLGLQMRAVADDPDLLDVAGVAPAQVRRLAWVIGSMLAALSGVLFASAQGQLDINLLSLLVVQAFGAAAIARFTSLPMAFVGGIIVGLAQKIVAKLIVGHDQLQGIDLNVPFIVLFIFLLVASKNSLVEAGRTIKAQAPRPSLFPPQVRTVGYAALAVFALFVPHFGFVGSHLTAWSQAVAAMVLFLSLGLLVRTSGQISLCHIAFAAIGASTFAHTQSDGLPWVVSVLLAGIAVVPLAALIAIPAIRLSGLFLGLATLGFGIFIAQYAYPKSYMLGGGVIQTPRPQFWGMEDDKRYYYLLLAVTVLAIALVVSIERSRFGRLLRGLGDSPTALVTVGVSINVTRALVFCVAGFLAGISGATTASLFRSSSIDTYNYVQSLLLLAVLAISGRRTVPSAVVASLLLYVVPNYLDNATAGYWLQFGFGFFAIVAACASSGGVGRWIDRLTAISGAAPDAGSGVPAPGEPTSRLAARTGDVSRVSVRRDRVRRGDSERERVLAGAGADEGRH
ncbi:hypothetical protein GCM10009547_35440 [Sporichthya brevicatena]|uniref:ABC transporter permease n=1 Tax=Sporichthya brevicatena TaxID=171442 RepID=A0ABN1H4F0_9ACTN